MNEQVWNGGAISRVHRGMNCALHWPTLELHAPPPCMGGFGPTRMRHRNSQLGPFSANQLRPEPLRGSVNVSVHSKRANRRCPTDDLTWR